MIHFWLTVLSVEPLVQCVVCNVLYCGKTVHPSQKVSEGVNRNISTSGFTATATETAVFALLLPVQPSNRY